jgi:hypothetical protein
MPTAIGSERSVPTQVAALGLPTLLGSGELGVTRCELQVTRQRSPNHEHTWWPKRSAKRLQLCERHSAALPSFAQGHINTIPVLLYVWLNACQTRDANNATLLHVSGLVFLIDNTHANREGTQVWQPNEVRTLMDAVLKLK